MRRQTSSTSAASRKRSCSPLRRAPATAPNCAPMTPPTISSSASTTSTVLFCIACSSVVTAMTNTIWNSDVPMTTLVGTRSR